MANEVAEGTIEMTYVIYEYDQDDEAVYDWLLSNGDESDELFDTVDEAIRDVTRRYS